VNRDFELTDLNRVGAADSRVCTLLVFALASFCLVAAPGCKPEPTTPPPGATRTVAPSPDESPQSLPTAAIRVGPVIVDAEIANTEATRMKGMMFRSKLAPDEVMLFVFPAERELSFWMKNTLVDLDLAYIDGNGRILQIEHMHARNLESVHSYEAAAFVLEAPSGWFARHGITEGAEVIIPPDITAPEDEE
jgi:uncharacterized protein